MPQCQVKNISVYTDQPCDRTVIDLLTFKDKSNDLSVKKGYEPASKGGKRLNPDASSDGDGQTTLLSASLPASPPIARIDCSIKRFDLRSYFSHLLRLGLSADTSIVSYR